MPLHLDLKANLAKGEKIMFMDGVHPTQATKISHGWIKKGSDKTIETTGSRTRLNILGAIELGQLSQTITAQYQMINHESVVCFLDLIRVKSPDNHTIHLVLDGAGYHRSNAVAERALELKIQLHFLPPYSPNLNPIERLWKVMNECVRNNRYFADTSSFRNVINHFFDDILPEIGATLTSRINDNFRTAVSNNFELLPIKPYAKDDRYIYIDGKRQFNFDVKSFIPLDYFYSKDNNYVYYRDSVIEGADPHSFTVIDSRAKLSKDKMLFIMVLIRLQD